MALCGITHVVGSSGVVVESGAAAESRKGNKSEQPVKRSMSHVRLKH